MTNKSVIDFEDVLYRGPCAIVAYARQSNGNRPAKGYIENLQPSDQAALAKSFKKLTDTGKIWNTERFRKLHGRIWEFKIHPKIRVLCFRLEKTWLLTHGYNKETGDIPPRQIKRAEEIMKEHISLLKQ